MAFLSTSSESSSLLFSRSRPNEGQHWKTSKWPPQNRIPTEFTSISIHSISFANIPQSKLMPPLLFNMQYNKGKYRTLRPEETALPATLCLPLPDLLPSTLFLLRFHLLLIPPALSSPYPPSIFTPFSSTFLHLQTLTPVSDEPLVISLGLFSAAPSPLHPHSLRLSHL